MLKTELVPIIKPVTLDFSESFNEVKCLSLLTAVFAAFDFKPKDIPGKTGGEPLHTIRQVARMVACEYGYAPKCVASVTECGISTAFRSGETIHRRIKCQGKKTKRTPYHGPLEPVVQKAREAAALWQNGGVQ